MKFENLKTRSKLLLSFGLMAVLIAGIGITAIGGFDKIRSNDKSMYGSVTMPLENAIGFSSDFQQMRVAIRDVVYASSTSESETAYRKFVSLKSSMQKNADAYEASLFTAEGKKSFAAYREAMDAYFNCFEQTYALVKQGRNTEAVAYIKGPGLTYAGNAGKALDDSVKIKISAGSALESSNDGTTMAIIATMIVAIFAGVIIAIVFGIFIAASIANPLAKGVEFARTIAKGDFTQRIDIVRKDEVGVLVDALNTASGELNTVFRELRQGVNTLTSSSTELAAIANQLSNGAEDTGRKTSAVAAAAEQMDANMVSVAGTMEQTSANIGTIAAATEELTSTIGEIAKNSEKARGISSSAVETSNSVVSRMNSLGDAAKEIGKVTETITAISAQTNLLALNATIEAARAGAAGKGFAVVANEIKELAKQTASATEDIKERISLVQISTETVVGEVDGVGSVIAEVNEIVTGIAAAIEQQSAAAKEIAKNISEASNGVDDAKDNVGQAKTATGSIAKDIATASSAVTEISDSSSQLLQAAKDLSRLAESINVMVEKVRV